ncbi:MAG: PH domain-containing protein [Candidatus Didemnitutus sp.]|nr:PH domain-containing protein [Candidatus Didemnitutus sp.]
MFNWFSQQVLRLVRVPHEPEPPSGAPGSIRVFRAGRNYYKLRVIRWVFTQIGAAVGIAFSFVMLNFLITEADEVRSTVVKNTQRQQITAAATPPPEVAATVAETEPPPPSTAKKRSKAERQGKEGFVRMLARWPTWIIPLLHVFEYGALLLFIAQIPFSFAAVRLEFEQHWYIVTDRSLRIRIGLLSVRESTMSFANLQQVEVSQGPLQRWLGLADVRVQSAGGGGGQKDHENLADSLHMGIFHSIENAEEVRDLILRRLRRFREAGLGEPDDQNIPIETEETLTARDKSNSSSDVLTAAHELLAEARALRNALS